MRHFQVTVDVPAPPPRVWDVLCDIEHWPEWTASISSARSLDPGPFTVGSRIRITQPKLPPALWKITEWDESATRFTWVSTGPGIHVTARHTITPTPSGSQVRLAIEYAGLFGPLLGWLIRDINQRYVNMEAAGLAKAVTARLDPLERPR